MPKTTKGQRAALERENRKWPSHLVQVPSHKWPPRLPDGIIEVWRSRDYLVQVYHADGDTLRLSVCRTSHDGQRWADKISWDALQRLKRECGYGDFDAVEVYPRDADVVNVANMRHLFVFKKYAVGEPDNRLPFVWRQEP